MRCYVEPVETFSKWIRGDLFLSFRTWCGIHNILLRVDSCLPFDCLPAPGIQADAQDRLVGGPKTTLWDPPPPPALADLTLSLSKCPPPVVRNDMVSLLIKLRSEIRLSYIQQTLGWPKKILKSKKSPKNMVVVPC